VTDEELDLVVQAAAKHAWERHGPDGDNSFSQYNIESEQDIAEHIRGIIDNSETQAFDRPPIEEFEQKQPTEVYEGHLPNAVERKNYNTIIILDPNKNHNGEIAFGTCYIRKGNEFMRICEQTFRNEGTTPEIVKGGRQALIEQRKAKELDRAQQEYNRRVEEMKALQRQRQEHDRER